MQTANGKHIAHRTERRAMRLLDEARARGEKMAAAARERGTELFDDAQISGQRALNDAKGWAERNPVWALGAAFVCGAIVRGFFVSKKD